jgi:hypothetical protein
VLEMPNMNFIRAQIDAAIIVKQESTEHHDHTGVKIFYRLLIMSLYGDIINDA